jgi:hypothetical protein
MMSREPIVKQMANLEGAKIMTGRKREKAKIRNTAPAPKNARNHVKCVVDGNDDWALHVHTPIRTIHNRASEGFSMHSIGRFAYRYKSHNEESAGITK